LRREIACQLNPQLTFQNNLTLDQTIEATRRMEENNKIYPEALMGFQQPYNSNPITMTYPNQIPQENSVEMAVNKALSLLIQAIEKLALGQVNNNNNNNIGNANRPNNNNINNNNSNHFNNNNNNNNNNRPPRGPVICYKYNQMGHYARNCPLINNNNQNIPPTMNNQVPVNQNNNPNGTHLFAQQLQQQSQIYQMQMLQPQQQQPIPQVNQNYNIPIVNSQVPSQNNNNNALVGMTDNNTTPIVQQVYPVEHLN
jgi:hypothetical protein